MKRAARALIVVASAAASLALTFGAWQAAREQSEREDRLRFDLRVEDIANALRGRMLDYEQVLRGAVALFAASQSVERDEWTAYVGRLETSTSYPGIQALGYGRARRDGSKLSVPVTYIEPLHAENTGVVGLDMYAADPARRFAMDRARDTAEPVLTGVVQLLQDRGGAPRPGVVLFLPVFRNGAAPAGLEARRAELEGFVYGAFRVGELLERTVGDTPGIRLRLLDVSDPGSPAVLYTAAEALAGEARFTSAEPIIVRGRTWRLEADALPWFGAASDRPRLVAAGGIAVSLLFAVLVWSLLNTTTHARELARRMTATTDELRRFRAAIDSHQDSMLMVDAQAMRIVYVNQGACRNLGYRRDELVGQSPAMIFADRDAERLGREYGTVADTDGVKIYRALHRRKDGSTYPVEISREVVAGAGGTYVLGIARDITDRLEAERRLALALGSSGLALFDWDLRTGLVHMGAEWGEIVGGAPEPSVTPIDKLQGLVHPDDLPALREQLRRLLKGEIERYRVEHRVRNLHGDWIWIESVAEVSERDTAGRALRVTGTNGDVTERKKVAEMKNVFVAAVSHELRTPLTGLIASLELLREGAAGELAPQARDFVLRAHANGERLSSLINDVLDLERVESGRLRLNLERLDASQLLREAAELDSAYAERFKVRLAVDAAPGLALTADQRRVLQLLSNLISNAAKFSPPGGEVRLAARNAGDRVVLSVSDQGPGIPADFKPRLFGRFEQASHGKGGTGLGLAICKVLVERMGGRIWCESAPGKGTTFLFELPRAS
jgi:PAS domain S-box-containing protein